MNFLVVNDEPPSHALACSGCNMPLRAGYIRHVPTQDRYCGYDCYRCHRFAVTLMTWPFQRLAPAFSRKSVPASELVAIQAMTLSTAMTCWSLMTQTWALSRSLTQTFLSAHKLMTLEGGDSSS